LSNAHPVRPLTGRFVIHAAGLVTKRSALEFRGLSSAIAFDTPVRAKRNSEIGDNYFIGVDHG